MVSRQAILLAGLCRLFTSPSAEKLQRTKPFHIEVYLESGCPFSRALVLGQLKHLREDAVFKNIVSLTHYPLGNGYFAIAECGESAAVTYDAKCRDIFYKKCGLGAQNREGTCFEGKLVCQHGTPECQMNHYLSCGKTATTDDWVYQAFAECMYAAYPAVKAASFTPMSFLQSFSERQTALHCANQAGMDPAASDALQACASQTNNQWAVEEAMKTPSHAGVPHVRLNGKGLDDNVVENDPLAIVKAICQPGQQQLPEGVSARCSDAPMKASSIGEVSIKSLRKHHLC